MFVIGTAGHIDHGKSSLITRLTGIDPDRLPEEKLRGMTIDIGFAYYDTPDGRRIGIIDVPGHERFVRNMIAGAGGIDAVILVVAADDGWMPQSQEHFRVTQMLDIRYGMVAITKIDLADPDWVDVVEEDIRDKLKGSFLEKAAIVRISSVTGEGFGRLREEIIHLADTITERRDIGKPRLYVDRSFVLAGMGGIVAGTLRGGALSAGQDILVFPSGKKGKIRTIQSHSQQVMQALPGQRTSMSLTGIDKQFLGRGSVMTIPDLIDGYPDKPVLAIQARVLPEAEIGIDDHRRLLMILGTTEIEGEARPYGQRDLRPGTEGIIFFKPYKPVLAFIGDRCIFRLPTPQITIGGGQVMDILDRFPRKKELDRFAYLEARCAMTLADILETGFARDLFMDSRRDLRWANFAQGELDHLVSELIEKGALDEYNGRCYRPNDLAPRFDTITNSLNEYFSLYPHQDGAAIDIVADRAGLTVKSSEQVLELMVAKGLLVKKKNRYDLPCRTIFVKGEIKEMADRLEKELREGGYAPPTIKELIGDNKIGREAFNYLMTTGLAIKTGPTIAFHRDRWQEIIAIIKTMLADREELTVASLRGKLNNSRKYALPILEETDRLGITERQGDTRIPGETFEKE
nr:selenocysteine-specific translation elongation factor [candidate division Zixibacteria bacterium]